MSGPEGSLVAALVLGAMGTVTAYVSARVRPPKHSPSEEWRALAEHFEARLVKTEEDAGKAWKAAREARAESERCDRERARQDQLIAWLRSEVSMLRYRLGLHPHEPPPDVSDATPPHPH